jgi:hypothetical protein
MNKSAITRIGDETFRHDSIVVGIGSLETTAARLGTGRVTKFIWIFQV